MQWIRFYKMLNELPLTERPDDEVLDDDVACDRWWDGFQRQVAHDAAQAARERAKHSSNNRSGFKMQQYQG